MSVLTVCVPVLWAWGSCVETLKSGRCPVSVGQGSVCLQGLVFLVTIRSLQHWLPQPPSAPTDPARWTQVTYSPGWGGTGVLAWGLAVGSWGGSEGGVKVGV